jgi:hypothetical protein
MIANSADARRNPKARCERARIKGEAARRTKIL